MPNCAICKKQVVKGLVVDAECLKKIMEKQMSKKVVKSNTLVYGSCPDCGRMYQEKAFVSNFCDNCGQRLEGTDD